MASLGMRTDSSSSNLQFLYRQPRKKSRSCCPRCCSGCCLTFVEVISGFIFLLVVATFFFLIRYFLEFPSIINGHLTPNFTIKNKTTVTPANTIEMTTTPAIEQNLTTTASIEVSAVNKTSASNARIRRGLNTQFSLRSTQGSSTVVVERTVCQVFLGSFQALKETYQDHYNDSSSEAFQVKAEEVESMLQDIFMGSLLKDIYKDASIIAISPSPFTVHFQLRFCNSSASGAVLGSDTVTQALVNSYSSSSVGQAAILVNSSTVIVQGYP